MEKKEEIKIKEKKPKQFLIISAIVVYSIHFIYNFLLLSFVFPIFSSLYWNLGVSIIFAGAYTTITMMIPVLYYYFVFMEKKGSEKKSD